MEKKLKHLEMIQNAINRLANNSFSLKLKSFIFVAIIFGFTIKNFDMGIWLLLIPTFAFWGLDGFYLRQEKLFRALYDKVRQKSDKDIDFSMDVLAVKSKVKSWGRVCFSRTIFWFHFPILLVIVIKGVLVLTKQ